MMRILDFLIERFYDEKSFRALYTDYVITKQRLREAESEIEYLKELLNK